MNIFTNKLELMLSQTQLKWAEVTGNTTLQQSAQEEIVGLHIRLQIAREQEMNNKLFSSI